MAVPALNLADGRGPSIHCTDECTSRTTSGDRHEARRSSHSPPRWSPPAVPAPAHRAAAYAQAKEQFFPVLFYRTGAVRAQRHAVGQRLCTTT